VSFSLLIALRYFFSKKKANAINWLNWISVVSITIGTAALIIVLSVFNGFESLVIDLYHSFDSDLLVTPQYGKTFELTPATNLLLKNNKIVVNYATAVEENALVRYRDQQAIVTILGVDSNFIKVNDIKNNLYEGEYKLTDSMGSYAVVGIAIAQAMQLNPVLSMAPLEVYVPNNNAAIGNTNPLEMFNSNSIWAAGTFAIQQEFDQKYIFVPKPFLTQLLNYKNTQISKIFIDTKNTPSLADQKAIASYFNGSVIVQNRMQQNEFMYKIMRIEKWLVFGILTFIILIASFNMVGSLSMSALEKEPDLTVLLSLGASENQVQKIIIYQGLIMGVLGIVAGFIIATIICLGQLYFGWLKIGSQSFVIDAFPVDVQWLDYFYVAIIVLLITFLAAILPSKRIKLLPTQLAT
jgi:lipoprotein-releasing system permease protein